MHSLIVSNAGPLGNPEPAADTIDAGPEDSVAIIQLEGREHRENPGP